MGNSHEFDWEQARERISAGFTAMSSENETSPEILERIWAQRASQLAQVPASEDEGEQVELVLVRLGREIFALDVHYVYDIRPPEQLTPVPRVPVWVGGVVNVRGRILSVVDLCRFFGLAPAISNSRDGEGRAGDKNNLLVVVETPDMEVALLTDDVLGVQAVLTERIQEASGTVRGLPPEYVRGVVEYSNGNNHNGSSSLIVVLDLPTLLADKRLVIHEEVV